VQPSLLERLFSQPVFLQLPSFSPSSDCKEHFIQVGMHEAIHVVGVYPSIMNSGTQTQGALVEAFLRL
jgi:hypothetical protein